MPKPRKSPAELKATGSYRRGKHAKRESNSSGSCPPAAELPRDVLDVRSELSALIGSHLTARDGILLDELAQRTVEVRRLRVAIRDAKPGEMAHTRITAALTAATTALDRLAKEFGMSPLSRSNLPEPAGTGGAISWE